MRATDDVRHLIRELRRSSYMKKPSGYTMRRAAATLEALHDEITYGDTHREDEVAKLKGYLKSDNDRATEQGYRYDAQIESMEERLEELENANVGYAKQCVYLQGKLDEANVIIESNSKCYYENLQHAEARAIAADARVKELHKELSASIQSHIDTKLGEPT